jgi:hypothetical protein
MDISLHELMRLLDTVRVFPAVKLTSIITDLTRLQRQASDYLQYLLDQREQLIMDSETYNDLISCIVGHAQRLREQSPKDASPAMVQKKKQGRYQEYIKHMCHITFL